MRYTLSVLTAACLLALGQPAWAETTDRDFLLRARNAALALPDTDRANATQLLQQLQASASVAPVSQRHLPFHHVFTAVNGTLSSTTPRRSVHTCCHSPWLQRTGSNRPLSI